MSQHDHSGEEHGANNLTLMNSNQHHFLRQRRIYQSDRFIPARAATDFDYCHYMVTESALRSELPDVDDTHGPDLYQELLAVNLLHNNTSCPARKSLLAIRSPALSENQLVDMSGFHTFQHSGLTVLPLRPRKMRKTSTSNRDIPSSPADILDVPGLHDDYYLNLMAWAANGVLAVALGQVVYLYCTATNKTQEIRACFAPDNYVTSVAWAGTASTSHAQRNSATQLAVGTFLADLQLWDVETCTKLRSLSDHGARISCLSWSNNGSLASGSRDTRILLNDMRSSRHVVAKLAHHTEEVCGLAWSPDGSTLASGSNDNRLCLWDNAMVRFRGDDSTATPRCTSRDHHAAVRALAWSPWERHLLASGGGAADGTIKLWNSSRGQLKCSVSTGSQVCALVWSNTTRKLVSAHGHFSDNQVSLWEYPTMTRARDLTGHAARVLHLALSPDGSSIVSAGADETLRFWNVFPASQSSWDSGHLDLRNEVIR